MTFTFQTKKQIRNEEIRECLATLECKIRNCVVSPIPEIKLWQVIDSIINAVHDDNAEVEAADIAAFAANAEVIYLGEGVGKGESMAEDAACSVFADLNCDAALPQITEAIILIAGPVDTNLEDVVKVAELIQEKLPSDTCVILSVSSDKTLDSEMRVTVILAEGNQRE